MASGTPLGAMYIELGLDVSNFNPTLTGAKNAVKYFQNTVRSLDSTLKGNEKMLAYFKRNTRLWDKPLIHNVKFWMR